MESMAGQTVKLRLLHGPLGIFLFDSNLSATTICTLVAVGLFSHCTGHCMACSLSMGFDVLANGEGWEIK